MDELKAKGATVVEAAQNALMGKLKGALAEGGVEHAMKYCNANANLIIDSLQKVHGMRIRRVSKKYRNKLNSPSYDESNVLEVFEYAVKNGKPLTPVIFEKNHSMYTYFSPIVVKPMCLSCHGSKDNGYTAENFETIKAMYPTDKAFNCEVGDFRGAWTVDIPY